MKERFLQYFLYFSLGSLILSATVFYSSDASLPHYFASSSIPASKNAILFFYEEIMIPDIIHSLDPTQLVGPYHQVVLNWRLTPKQGGVVEIKCGAYTEILGCIRRMIQYYTRTSAHISGLSLALSPFVPKFDDSKVFTLPYMAIQGQQSHCFEIPESRNLSEKFPSLSLPLVDSNIGSFLCAKSVEFVHLPRSIWSDFLECSSSFSNNLPLEISLHTSLYQATSNIEVGHNTILNCSATKDETTIGTLRFKGIRCEEEENIFRYTFD